MKIIVWVVWISMRFVPHGVIDNKSALIQVMAWHLPGDKPLPEPMVTEMFDLI